MSLAEALKRWWQWQKIKRTKELKPKLSEEQLQELRQSAFRMDPARRVAAPIHVIPHREKFRKEGAQLEKLLNWHMIEHQEEFQRLLRRIHSYLKRLAEPGPGVPRGNLVAKCYARKLEPYLSSQPKKVLKKWPPLDQPLSREEFNEIAADRLTASMELMVENPPTGERVGRNSLATRAPSTPHEQSPHPTTPLLDNPDQGWDRTNPKKQHEKALSELFATPGKDAGGAGSFQAEDPSELEESNDKSGGCDKDSGSAERGGDSSEGSTT
jgi:hypothetical protein